MFPSPRMTLQLLMFFLLLAIPIQTLQAQSLDARLLRNIHEGYKPESTEAKLLEAFTNSAYGIVALPPVLLFAAGGLKSDKSLRSDALQILTTQVVNYGITYSLKFSVNRDRPYLSHDWVNTDIEEVDSSYPSAHTSGVVALAAFMHLRYQKRWLTVVGYSYAAATMYARMRQGVHYPADVISGAAIGLFSGWITNRAFRSRSDNLSIGLIPASTPSSSQLSFHIRF